jgi:hypothetical protein
MAFKARFRQAGQEVSSQYFLSQSSYSLIISRMSLSLNLSDNYLIISDSKAIRKEQFQKMLLITYLHNALMAHLRHLQLTAGTISLPSSSTNI